MERWWGFRPCTPDEGPLLGPGPIQGLWLAAGHHRNGVLLAAITAALIAAALQPGHAEVVAADPAADDDNRDWLHSFRWDRFNPAAP